MDRLRPLYIFGNMTTFVSYVKPQFLLDDNGIRDMASTWPNLRTLCLPALGWLTHTSRRGAPHISLGGLAVLVQTCQNLTCLRLEIDARISVDPPLHTATPNVLMRELDLQQSPVEDARRVSTFLARVLLNLRKITTRFLELGSIIEPRSQHNRWLAVQQHLLHIQEQGRVLISPFCRIAKGVKII
jgi:hypothetical protein